MKLLLDTHALLWFCEGNPILGAAALSVIQDETNERFVSHATAWEIAIKLGIGRLKIKARYEELFPGVLLANGFRTLQPDYSHYRALLELPPHHRDPFDRLLVAQAKVEGMTLITCDPSMLAYGIPLLW
jgi:PIN domain nuclease of toxin-antitoxin system